MRAVYLDNIQGDSIEIKDEKFHHFKNVLRIKKQQSILALDGQGHSRMFEVEDLEKRYLILKGTSPIKVHLKKNKISLALAQVKKEALDLSLKMALELGVDEIFILETEFSQKYDLNEKRIKTIMISALEQSNSPFMPSLREISLKEFLSLGKKTIYLSLEKSSLNNVDNLDECCLLIGPEAGFSDIEHDLICQNIDTSGLHLNTNILRAQTAVAAGFGYILNAKNNIDA